MKTFSSTLGIIILVIFLGYPAGLDPARAQAGDNATARLDLSEPYRELQYAFANGFTSALKFIHKEMKAGRMEPEKLAALTANKKGRLRDLILKMTLEYQGTLIKLNAAQQNQAATE